MKVWWISSSVLWRCRPLRIHLSLVPLSIIGNSFEDLSFSFRKSILRFEKCPYIDYIVVHVVEIIISMFSSFDDKFKAQVKQIRWQTASLLHYFLWWKYILNVSLSTFKRDLCECCHMHLRKCDVLFYILVSFPGSVSMWISDLWFSRHHTWFGISSKWFVD